MMNRKDIGPPESDALTQANTVRKGSSVEAHEISDLQYICELWNATHVTNADPSDLQALITTHGWELVADILWWLSASPTWYVELTDTKSLRFAFSETLKFYREYLRQALEADVLNLWDDWINLGFWVTCQQIKLDRWRVRKGSGLEY
jgi:hypothetical protein